MKSYKDLKIQSEYPPIRDEIADSEMGIYGFLRKNGKSNHNSHVCYAFQKKNER